MNTFKAIPNWRRLANCLGLVVLASFSLACSITSSNTTPLEIGESAYRGEPAIDLSSVQEKRLAARVAEYYDERLPMSVEDSFYLQRLLMAEKKLGVKEGSFRYGVYLNNRIHAFALANGDIRFYSGMLDVLSADEELLALLAFFHTEIEEGFTAEAVEQSYNAAIEQDPSFEAALREPPFPEPAIRNVAERTTTYRFSGEQLQRCDRSAATKLKQAGADPKAVLRLLERLGGYEQNAAETGSEVFDINRSHPMALQRRRLLASQLGIALPNEPKLSAEDEQALIASMANPPPAASESDEDEEPSEASTATPSEVPAFSNEQGEGPVKSATLSAAPQSDDERPNEQREMQIEEDEAKLIDRMLEEDEADAARAVAEKETAAVNRQAAVATGISPGWYIQLSADTLRPEAEERLGALSARFSQGLIQPVVVGGIQYFRVLIGPFPARPQAAALLPDVAESNLADGEPFVRQLP